MWERGREEGRCGMFYFKKKKMNGTVAFLLKRLNKYKVNYFTYEKELFGLIEALKTWRYLLLEKYFEVFTDHRIIINLIEQKDLRGRHGDRTIE
jgi:RNase H-like domain found in reverse transcriptase